MRRFGYSICLSMSALFWSFPAMGQQESSELPSAEPIIASYLEAIGGEMAISGIEPLLMQGTTSDSGGGKFVWKFRDGAFYRKHTLTRGMEPENGFNGDRTWEKSGPHGISYPMSASHKELMLETHGHPQLAMFLANYPGEVNVLAKTTLGQKSVYRLEFIATDDFRFERFFGVEDGLLWKTIRGAGDKKIEHLFEYQSHDGINFLKKITWRYYDGRPPTTNEIDDIQINADISEHEVEIPAGLRELAVAPNR